MNLSKLFDHMRWADAAVLEALRPANPPAKALEVYAHILGAEHVWLARLQQRQPKHAVWPALDVDQCAALAAENGKEYQAYIESVSPAGLVAEIPYTNSAGQSFRSRVDDILTHVALHGCYHRGQVASILRAGGMKPAPTDYIGFVRGVPAATRSA